MEKVSVILTSYNHAKYLRQAIDSVLGQTYNNLELIIWDDCSQDNSWEIIKSYSDTRVLAYRNQGHMRAVFGINKAISDVANGNYIAIHHSDDIWEPDKLEKQSQYLDVNKEIGAVFSAITAIDENGVAFEKECATNRCFNQVNRSRFEWLNYFFLYGNALCHPSILIRKQCYVDCGLYNDTFYQMLDFEMWVRLCAKYEIRILNEPLVKLRLRDGNANTSGDRPEVRIRTVNEYTRLLHMYRRIVDRSNVFRIFPEAVSYDRREATDSEYVLSRICLDSRENYRHLLGINILWDTISDESRRKSIETNYNFSVKDFIAITAKYDVFARQQIDDNNRLICTLESELSVVKSELSVVKSELETLYRSRLWRLIAPLRKVYGLLRRVRGAH